MIGNIRVSVLVSVIICISALVTLIVIRKKQKAVIADGDYTSMFESEEETAEESLEEKEETNE